MSDAIKVLIIDDNEDDRELYRRTLTKTSETPYAIGEADTGERGLSRIGEDTPDCVLLDYSLPGRNGIEVLKRLRAQYPFVPVVMLTGQGNEAVAVSAMQEGAQNYIAKTTITPETLQRAIRVAIEHCTMQKRIHEQRASLEIFTHALAHDLKEPVRTIKSFLDLLGNEKLSDKGRGYFDFIRNASDRMAKLIDAVYFYTRLDGSPQEIAKEPCEMDAILADVKENIGNLIDDRQARIIAEPLPLVVANRLQLMQVLQNLICNAIHHCTVQPIIRIDARGEENHWLFRVVDNGPGIDPAQRDKVFEPFKRLTRSKEQGLGLGLAICRRIVESHGGRIWFESALEGGTAFNFTLPKETAAAGAERNGAGVQPAKEASSENRLLANVLLVEDNEADIELARIMLLEEAGLRCNLLVARDAREAAAMMRDRQQNVALVDLILLDINMPGMDGLELLSRMRSEEGFPHIPVVMCTTSSYDRDMDRAKSLGAQGYITKPAELSKLKPVFEKVITLRLCRDGGGYILLRAA